MDRFLFASGRRCVPSLDQSQIVHRFPGRRSLLQNVIFRPPHAEDRHNFPHLHRVDLTRCEPKRLLPQLLVQDREECQGPPNAGACVSRTGSVGIEIGAVGVTGTSGSGTTTSETKGTSIQC